MGKVIPKSHFILFTFLILSFASTCFSAIKQDRKLAKEYRDKGYKAQRLGNLDMALSYYQRAIDADPYYAVVYNDIGIVLEAKGMNEKAKQTYRKAISLDPNNLSAYYNLAALYEKEGDYNKAAYYWRMRVNLGDWSDTWTWKAREHLEKLSSSGKIDKQAMSALEANNLGLVSNPKRDAQYHLYRARQYLAADRYIEALKELNSAIILDPHNKQIKELLEQVQEKVLLNN